MMCWLASRSSALSSRGPGGLAVLGSASTSYYLYDLGVGKVYDVRTDPMIVSLAGNIWKISASILYLIIIYQCFLHLDIIVNL